MEEKRLIIQGCSGTYWPPQVTNPLLLAGAGRGLWDPKPCCRRRNRPKFAGQVTGKTEYVNELIRVNRESRGTSIRITYWKLSACQEKEPY
ncbi:hypothetical protein P7K49_021041 [Saguinus oedipus]|uniref:Uncharacterized protein n=1 Tax=Saguinus oedipus TaxID=9490 RepID=A0ABQ9URI1_SAGOE|nr:hypothetical protein P7K49_021041 [Saguinus oedipus]